MTGTQPSAPWDITRFIPDGAPNRKTSHALKQQDSSPVWRELSEITLYGLLTLQMGKDPKWFGTLAKVTGTWWDSTPFCWGFSPCHPSHHSPLACQRTAGLPLNESPDLCRLGPISAKLSQAAKCPAGQQLRPVWQDILG